MRAFAKGFYSSSAWRGARAAFLRSKRFRCERCGGFATIAHHRTWLNEVNINDVKVALGFSNLEALCMTCHNAEHGGGAARFTVGEGGRILPP